MVWLFFGRCLYRHPQLVVKKPSRLTTFFSLFYSGVCWIKISTCWRLHLRRAHRLRPSDLDCDGTRTDASELMHLRRARARLYRSEILQENMRLKRSLRKRESSRRDLHNALLLHSSAISIFCFKRCQNFANILSKLTFFLKNFAIF